MPSSLAESIGSQNNANIDLQTYVCYPNCSVLEAEDDGRRSAMRNSPGAKRSEIEYRLPDRGAAPACRRRRGRTLRRKVSNRAAPPRS